jgi:hypothetical protein
MPPTIENYQFRLAHLVIDPATLRNQGASGVAEAARKFLVKLDLRKFVTDHEATFARELDMQTDLLKESLPRGAQNWGTARKAINLLLGEAYYHRFLCTAYDLQKIESYLEIPLDGQVGDFLTRKAREAGDVHFPGWPGIKYLTSPISKRYQSFAADFARSKGDGWARIHLDVIIWQRSESLPDVETLG